jgi:hypothetical protein
METRWPYQREENTEIKDTVLPSPNEFTTEKKIKDYLLHQIKKKVEDCLVERREAIVGVVPEGERTCIHCAAMMG